MPSLFQGLAGVPRHHTFRFVSFSGEEEGMVGSTSYVQEIVKTHQAVVAMVNMDTLGLGETEIWSSHADPRLVELMGWTAASAKLPVIGRHVEQVRSTDSESFREKKIPAITIHSLTQETLPILYSFQRPNYRCAQGSILSHVQAGTGLPGGFGSGTEMIT